MTGGAVSDPRELAAVVRQWIDDVYGDEARTALDALVAECEDGWKAASGLSADLTHFGHKLDAAEARARRYEEALREIADRGGLPSQVIARAALAEEEA